VFVDENTLGVDADATEQRRAELRAARSGDGSLNELFSREAGRLIPSRSPTSEAGNKAFGLD
jgi:hypothetical protein